MAAMTISIVGGATRKMMQRAAGHSASPPTQLPLSLNGIAHQITTRTQILASLMRAGARPRTLAGVHFKAIIVVKFVEVFLQQLQPQQHYHLLPQLPLPQLP